MPRSIRHRSEDGLTTLSTLIGAVLGAMVIGGFMMFWFTADDGAQTSAEHSRQETAANTVLNRAGRDVSEARVVVRSNDRDFVVEKVASTPTASDPAATTTTRTRYAVEERDGKQVLVRQVDDNAPSVFDDTTFTPDTEQVLGRNLVVESDNGKTTKFTYRSAAGSETSTPSEVGRVDITYVANTKGGKVEVESSASLNNAIGGDGQRGGSNGALDADEDQITIVAGQTGTVNIAANDSWTGAPNFAVVPGHGLPGTVDVNAGTGVVTITPSATISVPRVYTLTYRLTDGSGGSVTSTIRVSVQVPLDQPPVTWADICTTDGSDTFTLPARTGIIYTVSTNGGPYVDTPSGQHDVSGEGTVISVGLRAVTDNPAPGYVIREGSNFVLTVAETAVYTFDEMTCSVQPWVSNGADNQNDASGVNTITFSGGNLRYERVAGNDSNPASGWVPAASGMIRGTVDHAVGLGTRYTYTVVKTRNRVEDTVTSRPNGLTIAQQNDQFPLVPAVSATGGNTGTNTVSGLGTGGIVNRVDLRILQSYLTGGVVALRERSTVDNVPATYNDSGASRGTEVVYFGVARSQCRTARGAALTDCFSWGGGSTASALVNRANVYGGNGVATAYQAPADRPSGVAAGTSNAADCFVADGTRTVNPGIAASSTNRAYHCASGASGISWTDSNADHNMPGDSKFCTYPGNPGNCFVQGQRPGGTYQSATSPMSVYQSGWGAQDDYSVRSCNAAGCAEGGQAIQMFAFAGPTQVNQVLQPETMRFVDIVAWYGGNCWTQACYGKSDSQARFGWSNSAGAVNYTFQAQRSGGAVEVDGSSGSSSASGFFPVQPVRTYNMRAFARPTNGNYWRRTATAAKGDASFIASPPHVSFIQDSPFCQAATDDGWQYGFAYRRQAIGPGGSDISNAVPLQVRHMWWMTKMPAGSSDEIGAAAAPYWRLGYTNPTSTIAPSAWTQGMTPFWAYGGGQYLDGGLTKDRVGNLIPPLNGAGTAGGAAHLRIEVYVTKANAGNPDFGDLRYWTGPGTDSGETGDQISGADIRVRAEDVTAAQVQNCNGSGVAAHGWSGGTAASGWYAMANGSKVTRRYAPSGAVPYIGTPNPGGSGYVAWSSVQ